MKHSKQFGDIIVQPYEPKYHKEVEEFELSERQMIYSSLPKQVLDDALKDKDRIANIAINQKGEVVGFFVLHQYYQRQHQNMSSMSVRYLLMKNSKEMVTARRL